METEPRFYTTMEYLATRFDTVGRRMALRASAAPELLAWQNELRAQIRRLLGLDTMRAAPLEPCVTERVQMDGYTRERVVLQTEPGIWMPLYVLVPDGLQPGERRAAVLAPHGHSSAGKMAPAGRRDIPEVRPTIEAHNYDYGVQFVRQGMVAFCPDARGFGERREISSQGPEHYLHGSCEVINHMAIPLGQTLAGMWAWDLMRLLDYVETRPECDPDRIGCGGLSGGGLQILWLAALDERVRCVVISGYYYGYKDSLLRLSDNCSCNYIPGMWQLVDMGDIGALLAPRPLLIETGDADGLNGARGVVNTEEQVAITRRAYDLLGAGDQLYHHIFPGQHQWSGVKALPWLAHYLNG